MGNETLTKPQDQIDELRVRLGRLEQRNERLNRLVEVLHNLSGELNLEVLLGRIIEQATDVLLADRSSLFLYDRDRNECWSKIAQGLDTTEIRFSADEGLAGHVARTGEMLNISDAYDDPRFNREWDAKTGYRTRSMLVMPMFSRSGQVLGVLQVLNKYDGGGFDAEDEECLGALATIAAALIENAQLYEQIEALFEAFVRSSITAIDERDPCTSGHSARVAAYTMNLARRVHDSTGPKFGGVRFSREQFRELRYASLLHDYGKIGVRENVLCKAFKLSEAALGCVLERIDRMAAETRCDGLERQLAGEEFDRQAVSAGLQKLFKRRELVKKVNSPGWLSDEDAAELDRMRQDGLLTAAEHENLSVRKGNLTEAEWDDMRSHVTRSYHILKKIPWPRDLRDLPEISYTHHEKIDGTGYPRKLKDDRIPLGGRMMCVADIYDALTASDRPYKKAIPHERACEILNMEADDGHLDAELVRLFIEGKAWDIKSRRRSVLLEAVG